MWQPQWRPMETLLETLLLLLESLLESRSQGGHPPPPAAVAPAAAGTQSRYSRSTMDGNKIVPLVTAWCRDVRNFF